MHPPLQVEVSDPEGKFLKPLDIAKLGQEREGAGFWVAGKELKLSYYIGETLLIVICTHYGNLI